MKQNLHTHSLYCDGKDAVDDMVEKAIELGYTDIGFSSHGVNHPIDPSSMDETREAAYLEAVKAAKAKYADRINVWLGVEEDHIGKTYDRSAFDYMIGSVHFIPDPDGNQVAVDYSPEMMADLVARYDGNFLELARVYFSEVEKTAARPEFDIAGHIDLITKYNDKEEYVRFDDPAYLALAYPAIDALIEAGKIIEINTGAISRGYRTKPYPDINLLRYIKEKGGKITVSSDCHDRNNLDCGRELAFALAKEAGFSTYWVLTGDGFVEVTLDA